MAAFGNASGTIVKRGLAQVNGIVGTIDVIVYPVMQSAKLTQNFEKDVVKNQLGFDVAASSKNENYTGDLACKLLGDTAVNAKAAAAFLAPLAVVVLSGFDAAGFNGSYTVESGGDIDLGNTKTGDITFKLMRYKDADQATLMTTAPA